MPLLAPFCGIRYDIEKVGDLNQVVTQPYDKITPEMQEDYYKRSEYNYVRLILNREPDPYAASKATLERWLTEGILRKDSQAAFYPYRQVFKYNGRSRVRRGLIGVCKIEPFESGVILPHERTLSKPKEDRFNLMLATKKQLEQVFMLYSDARDRVNKALAPIWKWIPEMDVTDDYGTRHCLWSVTDSKTIRIIQNVLKPKFFVIADGHHRYETALRYRNEMLSRLGSVTGKEAFNYQLVTCVNLDDPALIILPTHRIIRGLSDFNVNDFLTRARMLFEISRVRPDEIADRLKRRCETNEFILYAGSERSYAMVLKPGVPLSEMFPAERSADFRGLDVAVLHTILLEGTLGIKPEVIEDHVSYEREWKTALSRVDGGEAQLAFLLHPTRPEQVSRIAEGRERMPQKSTDFFPKLISGLVSFDIDDKEQVG